MTLFALVHSLKRQHASQAAGFAAVTIATAALVGWWGGLPMLSSWGSGFATTKPVAALCLTALGLALVHPGKNSRFALAVGLAVAAIAALDLFGVDFGINGWLVPRATVPGPEAASFEMINGMPLAIVLAGGSLAFSRFEGHHFTATVLGSLAGGMAVFAMLTYLTGIHTLYSSVTPPALPTAVGLLCVAGAIVFRIGTMPALRKPRPLWHLLVMLGCAIVAPLLLFGAYAGSRIAEGQLRLVRENLTIEARALSADVDREIIGEIERLQALAASPSLRQGDFAEFQHQAEASLAMRQSGNIMLIDRNMQQLVNTWVPFGRFLPKTPVPEPVERALATGKPLVTGLFMGSVVKQLVFAIIVPVQIDGKNRYVLVRSPGQHALARVVAAQGLPSGWQAVVLDAAHRIVASSEQPDASIGKELPAQWRSAGPGGVFEFTNSEGQPSLQAYTWSELTGWQAAVWAPKALLDASVRAQWWTLGLTALFAIVLVVALAFWLGRIIARSVGHAARAAVALGEGGQLQLSGTPVAEVDTLMAELRGAATRRQAADDLLRESAATFRAMFDFSSVGKAESEPESRRFLRANAAMCKFVGYSEAELLGLTLDDITHPDDRARARDQLRGLVAGELDVFDVEKRFIRKDGNAVWARVTVNVIRDRSGRPLRNTAVIQDIGARKQAEQALLESKARLQLALDAAQLGWWQYDPLHRVVSWDIRSREILDIAEDGTALEEVMKLVHPDDAERVWPGFQTARDPTGPKPHAIEFRVQRSDGEVRWLEVHWLVYFEGDRRERPAASVVGTIADITDRKEREEKERLLMREVNHRAKNMLSVVDAIARQTAARNPEDFVERFTERIQALSANQDLLVRNEWQGVDIEELVRAQLAHFADLIGSRIAAYGPKLRLNPVTAQGIGLALHELATNAGKYGALSIDRGRVDIYWGTAGDTFTISWTERDGPPVSPPQRRGFGTTVMEMMAERCCVDGAVDLDYAPSGVTWRLTCPATNALESWDVSKTQ
jgi:PAS domain S-box-containing protein